MSGPCRTRTAHAAGDRTRRVVAGIDGTLVGMDAHWAAREALGRGVPLRLLHVAAGADHRPRIRRVGPADRARGVLDRTAVRRPGGASAERRTRPCGTGPAPSRWFRTYDRQQPLTDV
ncbi:universal stress protein [Streptomyces flavofungini]|uniref:universal stress protein n=1 Tax=Streptomyces flavofungini TaxID=68200 RepID=UPI0025AFF24E|nr:universal stress protein [Streptomyces flavofungini]WJV51641.1 universal stress protein [Streptomyces flavofungini]